MKKKTETKKEEIKIYNDIAITLTAWELFEGEKSDRLRCSAFAGRDKDGNYNKDINVTVFINEDTNTDDFEFDNKRTPVDVVGRISFGRYKDEPQITIFAEKIVTRK